MSRMDPLPLLEDVGMELVDESSMQRFNHVYLLHDDHDINGNTRVHINFSQAGVVGPFTFSSEVMVSSHYSIQCLAPSHKHNPTKCEHAWAVKRLLGSANDIKRGDMGFHSKPVSTLPRGFRHTGEFGSRHPWFPFTDAEISKVSSGELSGRIWPSAAKPFATCSCAGISREVPCEWCEQRSKCTCGAEWLTEPKRFEGLLFKGYTWDSNTPNL
mgnify:CR=1